MKDLFIDTLNYLKEYPVNKNVDITDFVSEYIIVDNIENVIAVFKTLDNLRSKNYITVGSHIDESTSVLNVEKSGQEYFQSNNLTFSRIKMFGGITYDGLHYLEQKQRDKKQEKLYWLTLVIAIVGAIGTLGSFLISLCHSN